MAIRKSKINNVKGAQTLSIDFNGERLNIIYSRAKYTGKFEREIKEMADDNMIAVMLAKTLATLVVQWDMVDVHPDDVDKPEDEQRLIPVPINQESIEENLGTEGMRAIMDAIGADNGPNPEPSTPLNDTF